MRPAAINPKPSEPEPDPIDATPIDVPPGDATGVGVRVPIEEVGTTGTVVVAGPLPLLSLLTVTPVVDEPAPDDEFGDRAVSGLVGVGSPLLVLEVLPSDVDVAGA